MRQKSVQENRFTSTGVKFWCHPKQMREYRDGGTKTVVSTHISPEGACNLKCSYCSVTYRKVSNRIELHRIFDYVMSLKEFGLKAVIITGGGEPTIYPHFDQLVHFIHDQGLKVALITNGTQARRVEKHTWKKFTWVRVSLNLFDGWEEKIALPVDDFDPDCVIGSSFVFTQKHEKPEAIDVDLLKRVAAVAKKNRAQYIRLLPNCLLPQKSLLESHAALAELLRVVDEPLFFHQHKLHAAPKCGTCHQSYFRPYLSEVPFGDTGIPGSVYPCDSVVLNNEYAQFVQKYQLCQPGDIAKYLRGEIKQQFDPRTDCSGCVFTDNVNMLDDWKQGKLPEAFLHDDLMHKEFI